MNKRDKTRTFDASALILAGGRGVRMGAEKPLVELGGLPLVDRVKENLAPYFPEIIIVTNRPELYSVEDVRVICDQVPYQGPLAGIYAGLLASSHRRNLVIAADMPFVSIEVLELFESRLHAASVVVAQTESGIEPLLGFYTKDCLPAIGEHLEAGDRKPVSFYPDVPLSLVSEEELRRVDPELTSLFNVNTKDDLAEAKRMMEKTT